jgi:hypothetical protein
MFVTTVLKNLVIPAPEGCESIYNSVERNVGTGEERILSCYRTKEGITYLADENGEILVKKEKMK